MLSSACKKCQTYFKIVDGEVIFKNTNTKPNYRSSLDGSIKPSTEAQKVPKKEDQADPVSKSPTKPPSDQEVKKAPASSTQTKSKQPLSSKQSELSLAEPSPSEKQPKPSKKETSPKVHEPNKEESLPQKKETSPASAKPVLANKPDTPDAEKEALPLAMDSSNISIFKGKEVNEPNDAAGKVIRCFDCKHEHRASSKATSAQCPKCGRYIGLKNFEIKTPWNQRIQTRGDVHIMKKGLVQRVTIHCQDLIVEGEFNGSVDCSGDFKIRTNCTIDGDVNCQRLIVEKRAKVEFTKSVRVREIIIDGEVIGDILCAGRAEFHKKSKLTGDLTATGLEMDEGALHNGTLNIKIG